MELNFGSLQIEQEMKLNNKFIDTFVDQPN